MLVDALPLVYLFQFVPFYERKTTIAQVVI